MQGNGLNAEVRDLLSKRNTYDMRLATNLALERGDCYDCEGSRAI